MVPGSRPPATSARPTASAGITWPPVPPPAMIAQVPRPDTDGAGEPSPGPASGRRDTRAVGPPGADTMLAHRLRVGPPVAGDVEQDADGRHGDDQGCAAVRD